jgi:hypothetical protein
VDIELSITYPFPGAEIRSLQQGSKRSHRYKETSGFDHRAVSDKCKQVGKRLHTGGSNRRNGR